MTAYTTGYELVLNACEGVLQAGMTENGTPLCFEQWHMPRQGAEILAPILEEMFSRLHLAPAALRRLACVRGPGSFTGIRLTLATAAAMRRASHVMLAGLDYLQALATSAVMRRGLLYPGRATVITHARSSLVHYQPYLSMGPQIPAQPLAEARLLAPEQALAEIGEEKCLVCGSGLARHPRLFQSPITGQGPKGAPNAIMMPELVTPDSGALFLLARHGDYFDKDIEPLYLRPCDAVENLDDEQAQKAVEAILAREPGSQ